MRRIVLLGVTLLVLLGGYFGYQLWTEWVRSNQASPSFEIAFVEQGSIASTVTATGSIEPNAEVELAFRTLGLVTQVNVSPGQEVHRGQVLAELDTTELVLAVAQAKVNLEIQQAQLAKLERPPSEEDITAAETAVSVAEANVASAESALNSAQASYQSLLAGPSEEEKLVRQAEVRQAEIQVNAAQQAYDAVKNAPNLGALPQSAELQRATLALEVAKAQAAVLEQPPSAADLAAARNQIAQAEYALRQAESNLLSAQFNLTNLLRGPAPEDLEVMRAQVRQAQINQLQAENNLANAQLLAPFDGVVTEVNVHEGQNSNTALPDIVLTDLNSFYMALLVDEIDVRQIEVGQSVEINLDALSDANLTGTVTQMASTPTDVGGVTAYAGTVALDATGAPLRAGMSAVASITTALLDDVLLLPNQFIQLDRDTGTAFVYRVINDEPVRQEVQLGLRNENVSQIVEGLNVGDEVALVTQSSEEQLRGTLFGEN